MTSAAMPRPTVARDVRCPLCGDARLTTAIAYTAPPAGETLFAFSRRDDYARQVLRCSQCGHFISRHEMDDSDLYADDYVNSTYQGDKLRKTYEKIIALPDERSDNKGRCRRIDAFARPLRTSDHPIGEPTILDVGSGLCVFLYEMQRLGWRGTALDPDQRAVRHARETVGVSAVHGDFFAVDQLGPFDAISFNKVLEHVSDPVAMLRRSRAFLKPRGFAYVEVPDGEMALRNGGGQREEFFVEHLHVFSFVSLAIVASQAGFDVVAQQRLCEPSGKYSLYAFCTPSP